MFAPLDTMSCYPNHVGTCVPSHFSCIRLLATLWTAACQAPLSIGFSRQVYWSRLLFSSPGDLPDPGIKPKSLMSPELAGRFFTTGATWESEKILVTQLCLTLCDPMDCSPPASSVHGILQARILEWVASPFSRGSSRLKDWTQVSCFAGRFFTIWATG